MTLLNLESAAKQAAEYYLKHLPNHPLEGLDYNLLAKKVLKESTSNSEQKTFEQKVLMYSGMEWNLYKTDQFEEHFRLKMLEWLATP